MYLYLVFKKMQFFGDAIRQFWVHMGTVWEKKVDKHDIIC